MNTMPQVIARSDDDDLVTVTFQTRCDLLELTDGDLENLGEFVKELAVEVRERRERGLA